MIALKSSDSCCKSPRPLAVRGRLVSIQLSNFQVLAHGDLCVSCWSVLADGRVGTVHPDERLALSRLSVPVGFARDAIQRKIEIEETSLPTEYQIEELGHIARIDSRQLFASYERATNEDIRARYREIFGLADEMRPRD